MKYIGLLLVMFLLSGCDTEKKEISLFEICNESGSLCEKLAVDSRCKALRRDVIINSYYARKEQDEAKKGGKEYNVLVSLEEFVNCSEKATFIEYNYNKFKKEDQLNNRTKPLTEEEIQARKNFKDSLKERENTRRKNYIFANYMLRGMNQRTKESNDPFLLYWHWSRNGSEEAIKKLEEKVEKNEIKSYRMKFYLSQYYIKFDEEKSYELMMSSLENLPKEEYTNKETSKKIHETKMEGMSIHFSILRQFTDYYYQKGDYVKSYIFAKLLKMKNDNTANVLDIIKYFENENKSSISYIENKVEEINEALEEGKFKRSMLKSV